MTSALPAEITFGAWLRVLAAPVASDGDETITSAGNPWGYGARTARLNVNASDSEGKAGFSMGIYNDVSMSLSAGDEANLWVKPLDMVKVSYGKYDNNTLRGDLCYGSWNWLRPTSSWIAGDEGLLMSGNGATGLMAEITPMENLYIQALVPITTTQTKAEETYKNLRAGFAYTVPETVKIKAQYIGKGAGSGDDTVVTTVMSNIGLYKAFDAIGIAYEKTAVGDKYVYECMSKNGYNIGGEESGHIIFSKYATTGDGILTSLMMMEVLMEKKKKLSELAEPLTIYPQVLVNVRVKDKTETMSDNKVLEAVANAEKSLGDSGRILVRESGTEPLVRVMAEAPTEEECKKQVNSVVDVIHHLGYAVE